MFRYLIFLIFLFAPSLLVCSIPAYAYGEEEIEDLIYIAESKNNIIAIIDGGNKTSFDLRPNEKALWSGSKGHLGAVLTNLRFLVISTSSGGWQALPLRVDESEKGVASLSPYMALLVTGDRAVGFDAASNRFIETLLPIRGELLAAQVGKDLAVVITSRRAYGLSAENLTFTEIHLRVRETVEGIKITSGKATVHTSYRLLTFDATASTWKEH